MRRRDDAGAIRPAPRAASGSGRSRSHFIAIAAALGVIGLAGAWSAPAAAGEIVTPAEQATEASAVRTENAQATRMPWAVGEFLEYTLKFGSITAGSGRMQVLAHDTLRGRPVWHLQFDFSGGIPFARVNDAFESWYDATDGSSLKFEQHLNELGKRRDRVYEIFPDRRTYSLNGEPEKPSVVGPLDDASFFFFIRTIPLEVGKSYEFHRYFDPRSNPVVIRVLRRDTVDVPAGRFPSIVVQPMIKTSGIFSEGGHAEIWLSADERRLLVQMKTKLKFGSLNLYLRKYRLPALGPGDSTVTGPP
jgi:hypothetical protein